MITDDSKLLRKKLREELESLGCEVLEASNGKEAIQINLQEHLDAIFWTSSCRKSAELRRCR